MTRLTRTAVAARAQSCCEYCLLHEEDAGLFSHEIDHILSRKHGGLDELPNLAYACALCNRSKGTDIAAYVGTGSLTPLFDPRRDLWQEHFRLNGARIEPLTPKGTATAKLLQLNEPSRLALREELMAQGRYPRHSLHWIQ